jgi:hypothetical protein
VYLKTKILLLLLVIGLPLKGQSFLYSYIDPCTRQTKFITADMSAPIVISYYGQVKAFTYLELSNGVFETWVNDIYNKYKSTSPCQGVFTTTTTTTSTNQVSNIIGNVTNLVSLDLSSVAGTAAGGVGSNIGSTTSSGSGSVDAKNNKNGSSPDKNQKTDGNSTNTSSDGSSTSSSDGTSGSSNTDGQGSNQGSSEGQGGQVNGGSSSSSGNSSSSSGSSGSRSGNSGSPGETKKETEKPSEQKIESQKTETQKSQTQATTKAAAKAKVETQKPAILMTGDIVGIQTASNNAQDARANMSFTRVKGDGTASLGLSADFMFNAKIGNVSAIKSWIGAKPNGNKHINVVSGGLGLMPQSTTGNVLFVRVNSLKNFTAMYGVAGTYGKMFGEELISTITIVGCMYKGKLTKAIDATIIVAGIYSPYQKYYTESLFKSKPIVIPFININYKITKTFGFGLTGGSTYIIGQDIINYQLLMGAKLKI